MTNEEVMESLKTFKEDCEKYQEIGCKKAEMCDGCNINIVIQALDKQLPLRAINTAVMFFGEPKRVCPLCGYSFYEGSNYCEHCGQRLV